MKKTYLSIIALCMTLLVRCSDYYDTDNNPVTNGKTYLSIDINTNKAVYNPGETVEFKLRDKISESLNVKYKYLGQTIKEETVSSQSWAWATPADDFRGYMVEIYKADGTLYSNIAVDVSSDWKKFPRYGFLSHYGNLSNSAIADNVDILSRYHINGIHFYDWMYDHQRPVAGTADNPAASWLDLIGRTNYLSTVDGYINAAHNKGMKAMFYNLAFGALKNAAADGVKEEWYLYKDANHTEKDNHPLDAPFRSSIYLTNPANADWQAYIAGRNSDVYSVFDFDGYHIDQLGDRGTLYDYNGNIVNLPSGYKSFITAMKGYAPTKRLVMNAVSNYAQQEIAQSSVDFLYTEVWSERKTYEDLTQVILDNNSYSGNTKNTMLAAYMNYDKSNTSGYVNTPGILLANAVIFSFGGAHLELGEHYLTNEYFPNANLQMKTELRKSLINYYDFMVAYQNLLRDGGAFTSYNVQSTDGKLSVSTWPSQKGNVAAVGKKFADKDIIHLINFTNATSMEWRDTKATQAEAVKVENAEIKINVTAIPSKVWFASPDVNGGASTPIEFTTSGTQITLTLPSIKYWDMIVVEY